jgi:hypothetical protein
MRIVRQHLRLGAATWLVCHALAFSALLPRDCCAAHAHGSASGTAGAADHSAHGVSPATGGHDHHATPVAEHADGANCPMRGPDGTPCPMHSGDAASPAACQMTGVCNQPAAALAAVLMQAAVPPSAFTLVPRNFVAWAAGRADQHPHALAVPPDSPPPRL